MTTINYDADVLMSVIVTAHNAEAFLDDCLGSIVVSRHENLQIVIVDDGSTDSTPAIVDRWSARDSRIDAHRVDHGGRRAALVHAHNKAVGAVQCWVDADDLVHSAAISECVNALDDTHQLVYTHRDLIDLDGNPIGPHHKNKIRYRPERLLVDNMIFHLRAFTTNLFNAAGGVGDLEAAIDWDMNLRMAEHTTPRPIPRRLYSYRVHPDQMSHTPAQALDGQTAVRNAITRRGLDVDLVVNHTGWHLKRRHPRPRLQLP